MTQQTANGPVRAAIADPTYYGAALEDAHLAFWLQSSMKRLYPAAEPDGGRALELVTARNARLSFQACIRNYRMQRTAVSCEAQCGTAGIDVQVRRVGLVPQWEPTYRTHPSELENLRHLPGLVPDVLYPEAAAKLPPFANQAFWLTVRVAADVEPGVHPIVVVFRSEALDEEVALTASVDVRPAVIRPRTDFPVTQWWNADCIYDWYGIEPFGDDFFRIVRPYLQNMRDHGCNVINVPMLNGRREIMKRPPQLLIVKETAPGRYAFDWSRVRRFVALCKELGFEWFEWTHFFAYSLRPELAASAGTPTRIYTERDGKLELLFPEDLPATGEVFRSYLSQFMPELEALLREEGIVDRSLFHVCDEPGEGASDLESYRRARNLLRELAPWMKVMDAVFNHAYAGEGLTDYPVPIASAADTYLEKGIPHWVYYCTGPEGPYINRLLDTPLPKIRVQGLLLYKLGTLGFLHWGFNYWYEMNGGFEDNAQVKIDPFTNNSCGGAVTPGDPFVVYPGPDGPLDSIRWEIFAEAMQDYALLQTLGASPADERLRPLRSYGDFPKSAVWIDGIVRELLS